MRNVFFGCVVLLAFVCALSAQTMNEANEAVDSSFIIGADDVLSVTVRNEPEFSVRERSVRMDGVIALPMLGEIQVIGKTTKQLEEDIAKKLEFLVIDPVVIVVVDKVNSQKVTINGQVARQGQYALTSPTTVLDILARAGGLTAAARDRQIRIVRNMDGVVTQFPFNYRDVIRGRNLQQNILLQNGDRIMVP